MIDLAHDKLDRTDFLNDLFNLFENFGNYDDGGLTISINGTYGSGKSTLLNFVKEKNEIEEKYYVIKYDVWQNNLFDNPLIPILYSLNELQTNNKILESAKAVLKNLPKIFTNTFANAHSVDFSSLLVNENIFEEYKNYIEAISKYKKILTEYCKKKKVIFLIDELDRCLPEYQIKVMETLYNVFNIPNLILVITLDKNQLEHSIKQIFGEQSNTSGYLSKFIQYEIDLPENTNNKYIETLISFHCKYPEIKQICAKMFELANVPIRNCLQIVKEFNLICNEKNSDGSPTQYIYWYPLFVCLVLIIKKQYRSIYKKYFYIEFKNENITNTIPLNQTLFYDFLTDIKDTKLENILKYFTSKYMQFAFILYFINYFYFIHYIDIDSLVSYTGYSKDRIERIKDNWDQPMWRSHEFNNTLTKIKILK